MITIYQKRINDKSVNEVSDFRPGCWIRAREPNQEDISLLVNQFKLDQKILEDVLDPYEMPRVEVEKEIVYIFTRMPLKNGETIATTPLLIAVGENFVMTLGKVESPILNKFSNNSIDFTTTQKTQFVLLILSEIMKAYYVFLTGISKNVREVSNKFNKINEKIIINFVNSEEIINDFLLSLTYIKPTLQYILSGKFIKLYKEDQEITEDLVLKTGELTEVCLSTLKNIVNIREAYSAIITNDLNKVIKLFTSLTVILTIPTITFSLYGMNISLPFENSSYAFLIVVAGTIAMVMMVFYIFNQNKWL
jgi:magnesium transporter